jgi:polyisoprenoid-binding protein YceI
VHSRVAFEVPYAVATFSGDVPQFEASLEDGKLSGIAQIASLNVKDENFQAHLLSPEFFDAERNPEIRFEGSDIKRDGETVTIDGEITIKGITKPAILSGTITGPAIDHFGANRVGLKLETTIDRTEYDIKWNMPLPNGEPALGNEVTLKADLTLVAKDA